MRFVDLFSLVKCDWSPSSAKISFIAHDLHSLQFDCGLKCMRPNLGDLIILKSPEDGGIFLLLRIFFLVLYFSHSSTVSWGISEGTRVSPRLRQSTTPGHELWWHLTQEWTQKDKNVFLFRTHHENICRAPDTWFRWCRIARQSHFDLDKRMR